MSGEKFKIASKRYDLPESAAGGEWKFEQRPGGYWIAERTGKDGVRERVRVVLSNVRGKLGTSIGGHPLFGEVVATVRGGSSAGSGDADLVAQFPGKVRKVMVKEGQQVAEGEPLVMVEAMKMEFSVKAPMAARVKKLLVKEGQQLSPGDRFVDLEALT